MSGRGRRERVRLVGEQRALRRVDRPRSRSSSRRSPGSMCSKSSWLSTVSVPPRLPPLCAWVLGLWIPLRADRSRSSSCSSRMRRARARARRRAPPSQPLSDRPHDGASCALCWTGRPVHRAVLGLRASCRPSPSRLNASTVSSSAMPGKVMYHHAVLKIGVACGDHLPPAGGRRADADAEERQRRLEQDVQRDQQGRVDDHRRDQVRQDLPEHDSRVGGPERARRLDELLLAQGQHEASDDPRDVRSSWRAR